MDAAQGLKFKHYERHALSDGSLALLQDTGWCAPPAELMGVTVRHSIHQFVGQYTEIAGPDCMPPLTSSR